MARVAAGLDAEFCKAADLLCECRGSVVVTGMGKAGLIGRKVAATLSSTGTRSHFLHPAEAAHGDLGCLSCRRRARRAFQQRRDRGSLPDSSVDPPLWDPDRGDHGGPHEQRGVGRDRHDRARPPPPKPAYTPWLRRPARRPCSRWATRWRLSSAVEMGSRPNSLPLFHAGGSLGVKFKTVGQIMRQGDALRIAADTKSIREVFTDLCRPGRRTGAVMLVDGDGRLSGLFTDSDLAKLLERRCDDKLDRPIAESMACQPMTIGPAEMLADAIEILSRQPDQRTARRRRRGPAAGHCRHYGRRRHRAFVPAEAGCRSVAAGPRPEPIDADRPSPRA